MLPTIKQTNENKPITGPRETVLFVSVVIEIIVVFLSNLTTVAAF